MVKRSQVGKSRYSINVPFLKKSFLQSIVANPIQLIFKDNYQPMWVQICTLHVLFFLKGDQVDQINHRDKFKSYKIHLEISFDNVKIYWSANCSKKKYDRKSSSKKYQEILIKIHFIIYNVERSL